MLKLYKDSIADANLLNSDNFISITKEAKLFDGVFKLGSTVCTIYRLKVLKGTMGAFDTILVVDDESGSNVLQATLELDSVDTEDDVYDNYTLVDYMIRFNKPYSAFSLMPENTGVDVYPTLIEVLYDICKKSNVETDITTINSANKPISWYDSTISAREYIGYIAELDGGYAYITEDGKLAIGHFTNTSTDTIPVEECSSFKLGDEHNVTRVFYDDSDSIVWERGDTTGSTIYVDLGNVFITDEYDIIGIYNKINGFKFYSIETGNCPIGPAKVGELISFTLNGSTYNTICQIDQTYGNGWVGGYECVVDNDSRQESQLIGLERQVKSIKTTIDREKNQITRVVEDTVTKAMDKYSGDLDKIKADVDSNKTAITQNSSAITLTASNAKEYTDTLGKRVETLETEVSVTTDGLKIKQNDDGSFVLITDSGMEIFVENQRKAYATDEGFYATTFISGDWHIQPANNGSSLNFFRRS